MVWAVTRNLVVGG